MEGLLNLTPHKIVIYNAIKTSVIREIPVSPQLAMRLESHIQKFLPHTLDQEIPLVEPPRYREVVNIPLSVRYADGKLGPPSVIVAAVVGEYLVNQAPELLKHFKAIYAPDTGPGGVVRDAEGSIIGTTRLIQYK